MSGGCMFLGKRIGIEVKTYAEFLHPDDENLGQVDYSLREVDDRDPKVPPGWPADAIGVRFFDRVVVEICHPKNCNRMLYTRSDRLDPSDGTTFYKGEVFYRSDFDTNSGRLFAAKIPNIVKQTIEATMDRNNWAAIIYIDGLALPFDPTVDKVL